MNNIQLAILIQKYALLLRLAENEIIRQLPEEFLLRTKNVLGQDMVAAPLLTSIDNIIDEMDIDIELLKKNGGTYES